MNLSDAELIQRIMKRDSEAFAVLFDRYIGQVTDHLTRMLRDAGAADDVAQEVFLRVWNRADQWSGAGAFQGWLFRIATNLALNHLRGKKRRREQPLEMPSMYDEDEDENLVPGWMIDHVSLGPDAHVEQSEQRQMLGRMIADLPEEKREVFEMVHDEELGLGEVAKRLGIPEGTVKSRLFHARKKLADEWKRVDK
ncbi:MAG: RNA polymerase sigma-70 factor (ECF subfamily) [Candidatus Latescibacterota bacterium]|jgi:RNA polymerase sigma-70 factor (ECF subfamily)